VPLPARGVGVPKERLGGGGDNAKACAPRGRSRRRAATTSGGAATNPSTMSRRSLSGTPRGSLPPSTIRDGILFFNLSVTERTDRASRQMGLLLLPLLRKTVRKQRQRFALSL
jgi:hypothetical protein